MGNFGFLVCLTLGLGVCFAQEPVEYCGQAPYYPSEYVCYGDALCPVQNGEPSLLCGNDCYSSLMYSCSNGTLATLPRINNPFQMIADNPSQPFHDQVINACGEHFGIGGQACTYCPVIPNLNCAEYLNITAVWGSSMATIVPGGQELFYYSDGALGFTQAHSASLPRDAIYGGVAGYLNGGVFGGPADKGWYVCPLDTVGWVLYHEFETISMNSSCVPLSIKAKDLGPGSWNYAWQYI